MANNNKSLKRAFGTVVVALILCFAMLLGTTYAWFTDSVTSGNNVITSGNLDIALDYWNGNEWVTVENATDLFTGNLWEPGHAEVVYLKVENKGSLALQYLLGMNIVSEIGSINVYGESFNLSDYIEFGVVNDVNGETAPFENRDEALAAVEASGTSANISSGYMAYGTMDPNCDPQYVAVVVYMPTSVGNEANYMNGKTAPTIEFGMSVLAMQRAYELDSFGNDYDAGVWGGNADTSWYTGDKTEYTLKSAAQFAGLAKLVNEGNTMYGITINLGLDIDLMNLDWTPIGDGRVVGQDSKGKDVSAQFRGTFDGAGHTISNLKTVGGARVGLFGICFSGSTLQNVAIDGAYVMGTHFVGALVGHIYGSTKDCSVTNATVIGYAVNDDDDGSKVGGLIGYNGEGTPAAYSITGNTVTNTTVRGYKDVGGLMGYAQKGNNVTENTLSNVQIYYFSDTKAAGKAYEAAGDVVSDRTIQTTTAKVENNTVENVTVERKIDTTYSTYELDQVFAANDGPYTIYFMADIALKNEGLLTESYFKNNGMTIDGNGNTVVFVVTDPETLVWINGVVPEDTLVLGSQDGATVTVNDLTLTGTMQSVVLGIYRGSTYANYNTVLNNVNVVNAYVVPTSDNPNIAVAVCVYGTAEFNDCVIAGSTMSEEYGDNAYTVYDLAVVNFTRTTINGGKVGSIYTWAKADLEINGAEVDTIISSCRKTNDFADGGLTIGEGSTVGTIVVNTASAVITIAEGAAVDTIDFGTFSTANMTLDIADGTVTNFVANGVVYTSLEAMLAAN